MLARSVDYFKKKLYYEVLQQKQINKNVYLFSYFPTTRAERHYDWIRKALSHIAQLIALPSAYKIINKYRLQGPQIYVILGRILTLTILTSFYGVLGIN